MAVKIFLTMLAALAAQASSDVPRPLVVAFGDSLTAGYGLDEGQGFAPQLEATLRRHGIAATVEDAGVSGDTSAAGRQRLGWTLDGLDRKPDLVILELGGNDLLRSVDPAVTRDNLKAMIADLRRRGIPVILAGLKAPLNVEPAYRRRFEALYGDLAKSEGVALYPFFLDGAALVDGMMMDDGVHPTFAGVRQIVSRITPLVKSELAAKDRPAD